MENDWIGRFIGASGKERKYVELEDAGMLCKCGAKILAYTGELTGYLGSNDSFFCDPNDLSIGHTPINKQ